MTVISLNASILMRLQYIYQMTLNGCRLGFYEPLRLSVNSLVLTRSPMNTTDPAVRNLQSLPVNIFSGAASGILGAAAGSPFFLVKTRLQSYSPFLPVGTQHQYKNAADGMKQIYKSEGIKGLYRGVVPAMVRTGFGSSVQLPTYFFAKRRLVRHFDMKEGPALHLLSSTCSGFVVCCVMHPPDTIMSRMYNQTGNLYGGALDCLTRTIKAEGPLALYKGFFAHLARILPHTVSSQSRAESHYTLQSTNANDISSQILTLSLAEQTVKLMRKFEDRILPERIAEKI
jgi:solute carrier family 25 protein 34/35